MVAEKFQIHGAKITRKYISESKKLNLSIFINVPKQKSPPGLIITTFGRRNYAFLWNNVFQRSIFPQQKGKRTTELKK